MRKPLSASAPEVANTPAADSLLADLKLQVVTPMFGGGVETGELDHTNLIRASAIRGHLRFWWRACNAAGFDSLTELHEAERLLWGSAAKKGDPTTGPGAIGIRVTEIAGGEKFIHQDQGRRWRKESDNVQAELGPGYALFPFTPQPTATPPRGAVDGIVDVTFRLQLTIARQVDKRVEWPRPGQWLDWPTRDECKLAAEQALWAWITFGGVGSRTRRGCGSLLCTGNGSTFLDENTHLSAGLFQPTTPIGNWLAYEFGDVESGGYVDLTYANPGWSDIRTIPSLTNCRIAVGPTINPNGHPKTSIQAWSTAVESMQTFLQAPGVGRNPGGARPGQSRWPEVSAARGSLGATSVGPPPAFTVHAVAPPGTSSGKDFPRADLGLPRLLKLNNNDTATLEAARDDHERMASPVILKALPLPNGGAVPIALLLTAPHLWDPYMPDIRLAENATNVLSPQPLNDPNPANRPAWPWPNIPPHVADPGVESARDAFMEFVLDKPDWEAWP